MKALVFLVLFLSWNCFSQVEMAERKGEIKVDGQLDEAGWKNTTFISNFKYLKRTPGTPKTKTEFAILKDEKAIYIGIKCYEPYMEKLKEGKIPRDSSFWEFDSVEIFISPEEKPFNYYQFAVTAGNSQFDAYFIEGGNTKGGEYDPVWESGVYKDKDYWSVEVKIPLYCFYRTASKDFSDSWLFNITRNRFPEPEFLTWADCEKGFHEIKKFNVIKNCPKKVSYYDIYVKSLDVDIFEMRENKYFGDIKLKIDSKKGSPGEKVVSIYSEGEKIGEKKTEMKEGENLIRFEKIGFKSLGKKDFEIRIIGGEDIFCDQILKTNLNYKVLDVEIKKPFYANCIFPDQKIENIEGTVNINLPEEKLKNLRLVIELKGTERKQEIDISNKKSCHFKIKADDLIEGDYNLNIKLTSASDIIDEKEVVIRKLKKPEKGSYAYIDEDLNFVLNGRPIFVRGWCGNSVYMVSQAIRNKYGNKPDSKYVNFWECWIGMEAERIAAGEHGKQYEDREELVRVKQDVIPSEKIFKGMEETINKYKDDPQRYIYYLCDEPECRGISPVYLKYQYEFIKKLDPYRPVMIITRSPKDYAECADILNPHPYLNPTVDDSGARKMQSIKMVRENIKGVIEAGKKKIAAWCTPQAFSYNFVDRFADYPTFEEFNCMVWTSIVNGAKGLTPFIYDDHFNSVDLRIGVDFIYEVIASLEEIFITKGKMLNIKSPHPDIDIWAKKVKNILLIILVNLENKENEIEIESSDLAYVKKLYGYRQNIQVDVKNEKFKLRFNPYQVYLLTDKKSGDNLRTYEEVIKEINKAKEEINKKGNILYGKKNTIDFECITSDRYIGNMFVGATIANGITDAFGYGYGASIPGWVELKFLTFVPNFKIIKIYTSTIEDMNLLIWEKGDWQKIAEVKENKAPVIEITLDKPVSTVKMRIEITKANPRPEIYEVELYD